MASDSDQRRKDMDHLDPLYIHSSDNPGIVLVSKRFDGNGFGTWKRSMLVALSAKNKIGFVNGSIPKLKEYSENFRSWEMCNNMVISWIVNALIKEISDSVIYNDTAKETWDDLCTRFGQTNLAQSFSLQKELCTITQGNDSFSTYYTRIKKLWDKVLTVRTLPVCKCGVNEAWSKQDEILKLIQLLMGLNGSFNTMRGNILMMSPTPGIAQVYSMLLREERQREVSTTTQISGKFSAMYVQNQRQGKIEDSCNKKSPVICGHCKKLGHNTDSCWQLGNVSTKRPSVVCNHFKKPGHKMETCYKIIGYPSSDSKNSKDAKDKRWLLMLVL